MFYKWVWAHTAHRQLQQVHLAATEEVGCAVNSGLHHLLLVIHVQPAVQTDLEDLCSVMTIHRTASVMVDHCK